MKKLLMLSASALFLTMVALPAQADDMQDNQDFATKAAIAGNFEIKSSELALQRSKNPDVKDFAQRMITDHTKASAELKETVAKSTVKSVELPADLDEAHQKIFNDLKSASAEDFDADYVDAQENAHKEAISLFKGYGDDGKDAELKQYAAKNVPTLEAHHSHVEQLEDKVDNREDRTEDAKEDQKDHKDKHK